MECFLLSEKLVRVNKPTNSVFGKTCVEATRVNLIKGFFHKPPSSIKVSPIVFIGNKGYNTPIGFKAIRITFPTLFSDKRNPC
jgi:hypothetical protein